MAASAGKDGPAIKDRHAPAAAAKLLPARDVAYFVRLRLVDENEGRLKLSDLGRERYQGLPNATALSKIKDEAADVLRRHILHARDC